MATSTTATLSKAQMAEVFFNKFIEQFPRWKAGWQSAAINYAINILFRNDSGIDGFLKEACCAMRDSRPSERQFAEIRMSHQYLARKDKIETFFSFVKAFDELAAPDVASLKEELKALKRDFGNIGFHTGGRVLTVDVGEIIVDRVKLGNFQIELDTQQSTSGGYMPITITPLHNNSVVHDSRTFFHPHLNYNRELCWGEGIEPARAALLESRIYDLFWVVRTVLETYNPNSPYVRIQTWSRPTCHECFEIDTRGDSANCTCCDEATCRRCRRDRECGHKTCHGCMRKCSVCSARVCKKCVIICTKCNKKACAVHCAVGNLCEPCLTQCATCTYAGPDHTLDPTTGQCAMCMLLEPQAESNGHPASSVGEQGAGQEVSQANDGVEATREESRERDLVTA